MLKSAVREIKGGLGRYLALIAIVIIGVGFFSGLSICREAMVTSLDDYLRAAEFYDYRVLSTLGFTEEDVRAFEGLDYVNAANGAFFTDVLASSGGADEGVFRVHSITDDINGISLKFGVMPSKGNECIADPHVFKEADIGKTIAISRNNDEAAFETLAFEEYTIVGVGNAPEYLNIERGSSDIGAGRVFAYVYVPSDGFSSEFYHALYITVNNGERIYGDEYKSLVEANKDAVTAFAEDRANRRYDGIMADFRAAAALYPAAALEAASKELPAAPNVYVLTREANISYVSFENDSSIISGIAKVFPAFFFLVAALMCVTTMSRMIEDRRTQIGVLKSLGYGNGAVIAKFLLYAGTAGIIGCVGGYFVGTGLFPQAVWKAFNMLYSFTGRLEFAFNGGLLISALAVTCICTIGVTLLCCAAVLREKPADLVRPKTQKSGNRTALERVRILWNRLSFLQKVSIRNLFRFRQRFFMMIIGVGGYTALLVAGFGILDSLRNVVPDQYGKITLYDASISFAAREGSAEVFAGKAFAGIGNLMLISTAGADLSANGKIKNISVIAPDGDDLGKYMTLRSGEGAVGFPKKGEVIINSGMAVDMGIRKGDKVTLTSKELKKVDLTVSGTFENYIGNFAYVSKDTAREFFDSVENNGAYAVFTDGVDGGEVTAALLADENVSNVSGVADAKRSINDTMKSLDFVIWVIILCAAALAFVVMYNLTNINITERLREIATLKVLGFYDNETSTYIFRENNILTVIGAAFGLIFGKFLHIYVMSQVNIEFMKFSTYINWKSYIYSAVMTVAFAFVMQIIMNRKLTRINMAESLKTVE